MKPIKKNLNRAIKYRAQLEFWNSANASHPDFGDSTARKKYYESVFFNLLECQDGLCAYSEYRLAPIDFYSGQENWDDGDFTGKKPGKGSIDHYNPELKASGKAWDWENLFVVDSDLNSKIKRDLKTSGYIKPDNPDYVPEKFFRYDVLTHRYEMKTGLNFPTQELERIERFVEKILNWELLCLDRKGEFEKKEKLNFWKVDFFISQFPTAFKLAEIS